jgi:hypothetical protein
MLLSLSLMWLLAQAPDAGRAPAVSCKTVADCWLDHQGQAISRPVKERRKPLPRGDCRAKKVWLRHLLKCEQNVCTSTYIGDQC